MTRRVTVPRHAIVLTAGLGRRLRPLTDVRAKAAIPVAGEPIVRRIIAWLVAHGVTDLVLNLHHLPATITGAVGDGSDLSARVRYSWEQPAVLGSAGGPARAWPILGADTCLIVNGDTLTDMDLSPLAEAHAASEAVVTLALVANTEPHRYGGVRLDGRQRVVGFVPRGAGSDTGSDPKCGGTGSDPKYGSDPDGVFHFIGIQAASADAFRAVPPGEAAQSIGGVYDRLLAERPGSIRGFVCDAAFWDVGTPADYLKTHAALAPRGKRPDPGGNRVHVDPSARVTDSILWDDVEVGPECRLERCIVTDRVRVPARSAYRDAILIAVPEDGFVATTLLR